MIQVVYRLFNSFGLNKRVLPDQIKLPPDYVKLSMIGFTK